MRTPGAAGAVLGNNALACRVPLRALLLLLLAVLVPAVTVSAQSNVARSGVAYGTYVQDSDSWNFNAASALIDGWRSYGYMMGRNTNYNGDGGGTGYPYWLTISLLDVHDISAVHIYASDYDFSAMGQFELFVHDRPYTDADFALRSNNDDSYIFTGYPSGSSDSQVAMITGYELSRGGGSTVRGAFVSLLVRQGYYPTIQEVEVYGDPVTPTMDVSVPDLISNSVYFFEFNECQSALTSGDVLSSSARHAGAGGRGSGLKVDSEVGVHFRQQGRAYSQTYYDDDGSPAAPQASFAVGFAGSEKKEGATEEMGKLGLHIPSPSGLPSGDKPFAFAAWVYLSPRPSDPTDPYNFLGRQDQFYGFGARAPNEADARTANELGLGSLTNNLMETSWGTASNARDRPANGRSLNTKEWQHVALTYTTGDVRLFYLNGVLAVGSEWRRAQVDPTLGPLMFGAVSVTGVVTNPLEGRMAEVGFWNYTLRPEEVRALYNRPAPIAASMECPSSPSAAAALSSGAVVGIAIAGTAGGVIIFVIIFVHCRRKRSIASAAAASAPPAAHKPKGTEMTISVRRSPQQQQQQHQYGQQQQQPLQYPPQPMVMNQQQVIGYPSQMQPPSAYAMQQQQLQPSQSSFLGQPQQQQQASFVPPPLQWQAAPQYAQFAAPVPLQPSDYMYVQQQQQQQQQQAPMQLMQPMMQPMQQPIEMSPQSGWNGGALQQTDLYAPSNAAVGTMDPSAPPPPQPSAFLPSDFFGQQQPPLNPQFQMEGR